jgi:unsaturated rhamnogalacturonyl hydrolase
LIQLTNDELMSAMAKAADSALYFPGYQYKVWGYGEWIAMEGLLSAAEICGNGRYLGFVEGLIHGWFSKHEELVPADHVSPGVALIRLHRLTGHEEYMRRALALADLILSSPRSSRGARLLRPDAEPTVYVDRIYSDPTLFCQLGIATCDEKWFVEAVNYTLEFLDVLKEPETSLLYHGYSDQPHSPIGLLWGRGVGWAMLGLVDELANLPKEVPGREKVLTLMRHMAERLRVLQANDGNWHTVLDHSETYLENSIAAFVFTSFSKAIRHGLLDTSSVPCAKKSWNAFMKALKPDGQIFVSAAAPARDLALYDSLKLGVYPWGQGAALRAIEEESIARGAFNAGLRS